ncbi:MAG: SRPBCC family protein [bacterium]
MTNPQITSQHIEEQVLLPQSRTRVWRALTNAEEFGAWFGVNIAGATIAAGAHVLGHMTMSGYEHIQFDAMIEEMIPEQRFTWRWHPNAIEAGVDYSGEARTLVAFTLEDAPDGGTLLRVVESGFDKLPAARRSVAFNGNSNGWRAQLQKRLPSYLASS